MPARDWARGSQRASRASGLEQSFLSYAGSRPVRPDWSKRDPRDGQQAPGPERSVILLDTNVLSALMQREPDQTVVAWLDEQPSESIWTTSITVFEVRMGLELLATGRRRSQLEQKFDRLLVEDLDGRVQLFDRAAADAAGTIAASRQRAGRTVEIRDVQIAGIVSARKATLATRNVRHFEGLDIRLVNPWQK
jgi:toxin FitB